MWRRVGEEGWGGELGRNTAAAAGIRTGQSKIGKLAQSEGGHTQPWKWSWKGNLGQLGDTF